MQQLGFVVTFDTASNIGHPSVHAFTDREEMARYLATASDYMTEGQTVNVHIVRAPVHCANSHDD